MRTPDKEKAPGWQADGALKTKPSDTDFTRFHAQSKTGTHRVPCPQCSKKTTDRKCSVSVDKDGSGKWFCHSCNAAGGWRADRQYARLGTPAPKAAPAQHITLAAHWRDAWRNLAPICGTATKYLEARGCAIPPADGDLRCAESLRHPSGYVGPALVALVTDALTGEPTTLHRTWIRADGEKADVDPPRMLLGKHRKAGGVIRLWPDDSVSTGLAIAEGVETALTAATAFKPVWSCIDAGNLDALPVLNGIECLLIIADHDAAGIRASNACAERWFRAGREVRIAQSPIPGEDLNDVARRAA